MCLFAIQTTEYQYVFMFQISWFLWIKCYWLGEAKNIFSFTEQKLTARLERPCRHRMEMAVDRDTSSTLQTQSISSTIVDFSECFNDTPSKSREAENLVLRLGSLYEEGLMGRLVMGSQRDSLQHLGQMLHLKAEARWACVVIRCRHKPDRL